ncbi:hypothetical protein Clacol_010322 [Clathrus columnatus]|uniref:Ricin B lectin domain-containing protein n=1 Tax=Clathrus columnatus TaxID=1419009 RepID=A0AAV5ASQ9_9AGAM|nr:hypothetical protein Clacol_010322 [Clathrus columnatus]
MSFNGIYNITLNGGSPSANSAALGSQPGVSLVPINKNDPKQKWSIRPIEGAVPNAYVVQSALTGQYVIPNGSTLALSSTSIYAWIIAGTSGLYEIIFLFSMP